VDGFVAGPDQTVDDPIGRGGMQPHEWHFDPQGEDRRIVDEWMTGLGAYVMGRNMFGPGPGPGRGEWDLDWTGWWGDEPPYGVPVFVLTHHPRESVAVGRTTFHFVTDGVDAAVEAARAAAGERTVAVAGGASTVNQCLTAGLIDLLHLHVVPLTLGAGERLFEGVPPVELEPVQVVSSPAATHVMYRVRH
jgi:dihydrofolate reductase